MHKLNADYWNSRYQENQTGWDVGYPTTPIMEYMKDVLEKNISILIPGCGNGYEGEALFNAGFKNIILLDYSERVKTGFLNRVPGFPPNQFLVGDFFKHNGAYDLIIEQTFFCALNPELRNTYASKMFDLLKPSGKLVGLLFKFPLTEKGPPYGGSKQEYLTYFDNKFIIHKLEEAYNSITPRQGNELFINLEKSAN